MNCVNCGKFSGIKNICNDCEKYKYTQSESASECACGAWADKETCKWEVLDFGMRTWQMCKGNVWEINMDRFVYCPYCGRKIEVQE